MHWGSCPAALLRLVRGVTRLDDTQKQVFKLLPWVLMFVMAPFAVGLQVYWITSNVLTIIQQKLLYARHPGLKVPVTK